MPWGPSPITLEPTRVRGFDNHKIIDRGVRSFMRLRESVPGLRNVL